MNRGEFMFIDLSNVLSEPHRTLHEVVPCTLEVIQSRLGKFSVISKGDVHISVTYVKDRQLEIKGVTKLVVEIPCHREVKLILR